MIRIRCSNCEKILAIKDENAGKKGKCPACGSPIQVPGGQLIARPVQAEQELPDPLVAMASNAASSVASAAGSAASAVGNAMTSMFKRKTELIDTTVEMPVRADSASWLSVFTRDNQSPDVVRKVIEKVKTILMANEQIIYIAVQNKPILNITPDCIALTNKRFIFYRPKLLGRVDFEDYVWRHLRDAKLSENVIGSTISILTQKGAKMSLDYLPKEQARAVYRIAQQMEEEVHFANRELSLEEMRAGAGAVNVQANVAVPASNSTTPAGDNNDPMVKLQRLKSMLDAGLITSAEYDAKKADILASM